MNNMIWTDSEVYMGKDAKWIEKDGTEPIYVLLRFTWSTRKKDCPCDTVLCLMLRLLMVQSAVRFVIGVLTVTTRTLMSEVTESGSREELL